MHSKCDSIEIAIDKDKDEIIYERFQPLLNRYQMDLKGIKEGY